MLDVEVSRARCIGTKSCVSTAPATFELDMTLVARVVDPDGNSEADVIAAAEACPTGAISVWKDGARIA